MRKLLLSTIAAFAVILILPAAAMAAAPTDTTYVAGTITHNNSPVSGATVVVTCDSNTATSPPTTVAGAYLVQFSTSQCPDKATAAVAASKGSLGGSNSGTVNNLTSTPTVINLALVNVSLVPELGIITGVTAAILGGGAFFIIRRRQLAQK